MGGYRVFLDKMTRYPAKMHGTDIEALQPNDLLSKQNGRLSNHFCAPITAQIGRISCRGLTGRSVNEA